SIKGGIMLLKDFFGKRRKYATVPGEEGKAEVPEGLMLKCNNCRKIYYRKEWKKWYYVCPNCDHHHRLSAWDRVESLVDEDTFEEWDGNITSSNPLNVEGYEEKLEKDRQKTGLNEGVLTGKGKLKGWPTAIVVMDANFRMGSMGSAMGEKIARAIERVREQSIPIIIFSASGGARMQEGVLSLMQMAKTSF